MQSFFNNSNSNIQKKFAIVGLGFWGKAQLKAWEELKKECKNIVCVAVCDKNNLNAYNIMQQHGISSYFYDIQDMLDKHPQLDFIDVITDPPNHFNVLKEIIDHPNCPLIIVAQKPVTLNYQSTYEIIRYAETKGKTLLVHENWRWQSQIQAVKKIMDENKNLGHCLKATISCEWSRQNFDKQPKLKDRDHLIMNELGCHIIDTGQSLFGKPETIKCTTRKINPTIKGEDEAVIHVKMEYCPDVTLRMSYSAAEGGEYTSDFPQTLINLEFENGRIKLQHDLKIYYEVEEKKKSLQLSMPSYKWTDKEYELAQVVMVPFLKQLLDVIDKSKTEKITKDNVFSAKYQSSNVLLIEAAYFSAKWGSVEIKLNLFKNREKFFAKFMPEEQYKLLPTAPRSKY